jgi:hypothetical protein
MSKFIVRVTDGDRSEYFTYRCTQPIPMDFFCQDLNCATLLTHKSASLICNRIKKYLNSNLICEVISDT